MRIFFLLWARPFLVHQGREAFGNACWTRVISTSRSRSDETIGPDLIRFYIDYLFFSSSSFFSKAFYVVGNGLAQ